MQFREREDGFATPLAACGGNRRRTGHLRSGGKGLAVREGRSARANRALALAAAMACVGGYEHLMTAGARAGATLVTLTVNDGTGNSSISGGPFKWSASGNGTLAAGSAPTAGYTYEVLGNSSASYNLRTPTSGTATFGGASLQLDDGSDLIFKGATSLTVNNLIMNGGTVQLGAGSANATLAGNITLDVANTAPSGGNATWTSTSSYLSAGSGETFTVSAAMSGSGNLTVNGDSPATAANLNNGTTFPGLFILTGNCSFTGSIAVSAGTLQLGNGTTAGSLSGSSALIDSATLVIDRSNNAVQGTDFANISGSGALVQLGAGTTVLTTNNSYIGNTTISAGALQLGNGTAGGNLSTSSIIIDKATLIFDRSDTITQGSNFTSTAISGAGGVVQLGGGTTILNTANTYNGTTTISAGTLQLGGVNAVQNSTVAMSGGNLAFSTGITNFTVGGLSGSGNITLADTGNNSVTLAVGNNGGNTTYSGSLRGLGGLTKVGGGIFTLSGVSSNSGPTAINGGGVVLSGGLGTTSVTVGNGTAAAYLTAIGNGSAGHGSIGGNLSVSANAAVDFSKDGATGSPQTLSVGNLTLTTATSPTASTASSLAFNFTGGSAGAAGMDTISSNGVLIVGASGQSIINLGGTAVSGDYVLLTYASQSGQTATGTTGSGFSTGVGGTLGAGASANAGAFVVGSKPAGLYNATLDDTSTELLLQVTTVANPPIAYWYAGFGGNTWGGNNGNTSAPLTNWSSNPNGTLDAGQIPGANTDAVFTASNVGSGNLSTTLDASYTINSLTVNATSQSVTIGGNGTNLTIAASGSAVGGEGYAAGTGINVLNGAGPLTINTTGQVVAAATQSWTNASSSLFTVSSGVSGTATPGNTTVLTLSNTGSGNTTLGGAITDGSNNGQLALVINDTSSGITTLSGSNSYSGATTLSAGTLQVGNFNALKNSTLAAAGTVAFSSGLGNGTFVFGGLSGSSNIALNDTLGNAVSLSLGNNNSSNSYSGNLTGNGSLTKVGSGEQTLSGANTYAGVTNVSAGTLTLDTAGGLVSGGGINVNGAGALLNIKGNYTNNSGTGAINVTGNGTLSVSGSMSVGNTTTFYLGSGTGVTGTLNVTGNGVVNAGIFGDGYNNAAGAGNGSVNVSGNGTLNVGNGGQFVFIGGGNSGSSAYSGGSLTIGGNGQVTIAAPGVFPADNAYIAGHGGSGTINLNGGILTTARSILTGQGTSTAFNFNGGTLQAAASISILGPQGGGNGSPIANASILAGGAVIDSNGFTANINQALLDGGGGGGLTKIGNGTLVLNGANTYSGTTVISTGTLETGVAGTLGATSAPLNVTPGATLDLYQDAQTTGSVTLSAGTIRNGTLYGSSIAATSGTINAALAGNGTLLKSSSGTLTAAGASYYSGGSTLSGGTLVVSGSSTNAGSIPNGFTIAAVGDSITAGSGTTNPATQAYPVILQDQLQSRMGNSNITVGNYGISGATAISESTIPGHPAYVSTSQYTSAIASNPNVVIIQLGTNDSLGNLTQINTYYAKDLTSIINAFKATANDPAIYLCLPPEIFNNVVGDNEPNLDVIMPLIQQVATATGSTVIDNHTAFVNEQILYADGLHPNVTGAAWLGQNVYASLATSMFNNGPLGIGTITLASGTLSDDGSARTLSNPLAITGNVTFASTASGSLTFNSGGSGSPAATVISNSPTITVNNTTTISQAISGTGFTKTGAGTMALSGSNSYAGATTVSGGTLRANNISGSATGTEPVTVANGTLGGSGFISGAITVNAGANIAAGADSGTTGKLTNTNASPLGLAGGSGYIWKINTDVNNGGAPGSAVGWDDVAAQGIALGAGTPLDAADPFTIHITGSPAAGFGNGNQTFAIATAVNGITMNGSAVPNGTILSSVAAADFVLDTTGFTNPSAGFSFWQLEVVGDGGLGLSGQDLDLVYSATPEPCVGLLILGGALPTLLSRRRRRDGKRLLS
jgi:autotransporter-associated beta strand protein